MWTTLNFEGILKTKKWAKDICKGTLGIECERDRPVGLGATLGDATDWKLKTIFLVSGIFPGKADSVILLDFEYTINPRKFNQNRWSHFSENNFFYFFSCDLSLILGLGGKLKKKARDIYKRTIHIEFERDRLIGLGSTIGDGQIHTHTHIFFLKLIFRLWEWCRIKNHKKIEV